MLALDKKFLGAQIGVTMVLHSWGQNLSFHPHVHCIVRCAEVFLLPAALLCGREKSFLFR
jgi:hypothetical protein